MQQTHLHSKCYDTITLAGNSQPTVHGRFLIARQSPLTKLWMIDTIEITQEGGDSAYNFCGCVAKDLETLETLEHLSNFEKAQISEGTTERIGFTYPNTQYYRRYAEKEAIIFELDTGAPCYLEAGVMPQKPGQYALDDIANAAQQFNEKADEEAQKKKTNASLLDQLLRNYSAEDVDLSPIFTNIQIEASFRTFVEEIGKANTAFENICRYDTLRRTQKNYYEDSITYKYDKDIETSLKKAANLLPALTQHTDDASTAYLNDIITIYRMYLDMLKLQLIFVEQHKGERKPDAAAFESELNKIKNRYEISDEIKNQIGRSAINTYISKANIIGEIAQQLSYEFDSYKNAQERIRNKTASGNEVPVVLKIKSLGVETR
jgi:hypothetical protein